MLSATSESEKHLAWKQPLRSLSPTVRGMDERLQRTRKHLLLWVIHNSSGAGTSSSVWHLCQAPDQEGKAALACAGSAAPEHIILSSWCSGCRFISRLHTQHLVFCSSLRFPNSNVNYLTVRLQCQHLSWYQAQRTSWPPLQGAFPAQGALKLSNTVPSRCLPLCPFHTSQLSPWEMLLGWCSLRSLQPGCQCTQSGHGPGSVCCPVKPSPSVVSLG